MNIHVESILTNNVQSKNTIIIPNIVRVSKLTPFSVSIRESAFSEKLMLETAVDLSEFRTNKEARNHRCNVTILNCSAKMAFHFI